MLSAERIALLKHGAPPRNALEAALRNAWGGGGASYEKTVGPAPIISISDAKAKPAKSLIVGMEPIQDLHGYDSPWPAGGGKNLWNPQPYTGLNYNIDVGLSVTLTESTGVTVNGNKLSFSVPVGWDYKDFKTKPLAAGTYRIHFSNSLESGFRGTWYVVGDTGAGDVVKKKETFSSIAGDRDKNITVETNDYIVLQVASVNVTTIELVDWQIESGSSYTSWSPYENLCPISGRTGVTAWRTGKNLFEPTAWSDYMVHGVSFNGSDCTPLVSFLNTLPAGDYTISFTFDVETTVSGATSWGILLHRTSGYIDGRTSGQHNAGETLTFTRTVNITSANKGTFDHAYMYSGVGNKADVYMYAFQLQVGSTATAYEPYVGATFPVTWQTEAGTVYGGTVDVVSGVLTVTDAEIASYNGETLPSTWISDRDVYADGTTPTIGAQVVYELATPQTYQLTPTQIQLLKGSNTLWSDGDSLTLTYLGTTPANLLGGMLGNPQEPTEETSEEPTEGEDE